MVTAASERRGLRSVLKQTIPDAVVARTLRKGPDSSVLLTFDDGPSPDVTPAVLERLDRYGARALFFVIGRRVKRVPHLLAQIRARGHALGNHSHLHRRHYVLQSERSPRFCEYYRDVRRCQEVIERETGELPRLFRPPGGRLTPVTVIVPRLLGLRCISWSREVQDWRFRSTAEARDGAVRLAAAIQPRDIVLLHDDNPCVLDLLDELLPALAARGLDLTKAVDYL
jgi:peptidoglycan/xylan/chitin deacetylase (PgdA/CDA1 family)